MNPFAKTFTTLSTVQLLKVVEYPADYQSEAIEAAHAELENRKLTIEERALALEELREQEEVKAEKEKSTAKLIERFTGKSSQKLGKIDRQIKWMSLLYFGLVLYAFWAQSDYLVYLFQEGGELDWMNGFMVASVFYGFVVVWLFWKRKKIGWLLFLFDAVVNGLSSSMHIIRSFKEPTFIWLGEQEYEASFYVVLGFRLIYASLFCYLLLQKPMRKAFGWGKHSADLDVLDEELIIDSE